MIQWFLAKFELYKFDKKNPDENFVHILENTENYCTNRSLASFTDKKTEVDL